MKDLYSQTVSSDESVLSGFPSLADPSLDLSIDLNKELGMDKSEVFLVRAMGESMVPAVFPHDLLVVDRLRKPVVENLVIYHLEEDFFVRRLKNLGGQYSLVSEDPTESDLEIGLHNRDHINIWGVVTSVIRSQI